LQLFSLYQQLLWFTWMCSSYAYENHDLVFVARNGEEIMPPSFNGGNPVYTLGNRALDFND